MVASIFASQQPSFRQTLDPATVALIARMSVQPDAARTTLINNLIVGLKADSLWSKLRVFNVMAAHDAQAGRLNWVSSSYDVTPINSPTFTTDRGYTCDGASSYLNTGYIPNSDAGLSLDSVAMGIYINGGIDSISTGFHMGSNEASGASLIQARYTGNVIRGRVHNSTSFTSVLPAATVLGLTILSRTAVNATLAYKNGLPSTTGTDTGTSTIKPGYTIYTGCLNNVGSPFGYVNNRFAVIMISAGLNSTEEAALYSRLNTYLTAIGAN